MTDRLSRFLPLVATLGLDVVQTLTTTRHERAYE